LNFFNSAPDLPRPLSDVNHMRAFYRKKLLRAKGAILNVEPIQTKGYRVIETLFRFPQTKQPGFIYVGSLTIPFADRSYVLKVQEQEFMNIGMRETMIMDKMKEQRPQEIDEEGLPVGWAFDPYDPEYKGEFKMNKSEEIRHDLLFPDHPLSHVRSNMFRLKGEIEFIKELNELEKLVD